MIDSKLTWIHHIKYISNKIAKSIGVICKARKVLNSKILRNLYYTFIYPHLVYCNIVWGLACPTHLKRLLLKQKRAIRIICGVPRDTASAPLFKKLNILNIYDLNKLRLAIFSYKIYNSMLPAVMNSHFMRVSDVHNHSTRQMNDLYLPKPRTNYRKFSVAYQAPLTSPVRVAAFGATTGNTLCAGCRICGNQLATTSDGSVGSTNFVLQ